VRGTCPVHIYTRRVKDKYQKTNNHRRPTVQYNIYVYNMYTALGIEERVVMGTESAKGLLNRNPVQLEGLMTFGILLWTENANSVVLLTNHRPLFQRKCRFKDPAMLNKSDYTFFGRCLCPHRLPSIQSFYLPSLIVI